MADDDAIAFLQQVLPRLGLRWKGFRRVQRQVRKRVARRFQALGLEGFGPYLRWLEAHPEEWAVLDALCRVTISRFFRDRAVFEQLRERELPRLREAAGARGEPLRCWSAGCASGEEPYSLALLLRLGLGMREGDFAIVASDADQALLARARRARYGHGSLREVPQEWKERAFEEPSSGDEWRLRASFAAGIEWRCEDLRRSMPEGPFEVILCRNVAFTYLELPVQRTVLQRLGARLQPEGVLVLGAHESLPEGSGWERRGALPIFVRGARDEE